MAKTQTKMMRIPLSILPEVEALLTRDKIDRLSSKLNAGPGSVHKHNAAPRVITRVSAAEPAAEEINYDAWGEEDRRNFMRLPSIDLNRLRAQYGSYQAALDAGHRAKQVNGKWVLV